MPMQAGEWMGVLSIGILAFVDAAFFPISVQVVAVGLVLAYPQTAFLVIPIYVLASMLGTPCGYLIGRGGLSRWLMRCFSETRWQQAQEWMQRYGIIGATLGSFSPIPFPLITMAAGILSLPLARLLLAVAIGRGTKAAVFVLPTYFFGAAASEWIQQTGIRWAIVMGTFVLLVAWMGWRWRKQRQRWAVTPEKDILDVP